jgi:Tfp pilus assembly PilM family ATPase
MGSQSVGIEINAQGIRMARVQASAKGIRVLHAAHAAFPPGTSLSSLDPASLPEEIAAVLDARQLGGRETAVVVDHPSVFMTMFRLAAGFTDDLSTSIRWYAEQHLPYPVDQAALDHRTEHSPYGEQKAVFLVALHKAVLDRVMALLPPKRVKLRRIDGVPYAVHRLYRTLVNGEAQEPAVLVHAARSSGYVLVINEGRIEVVRHVRLGEGLAASLDEKVRQTCHYYELHHPTENVRAAWATLPALAFDGVGQGLAEQLGFEVRPLDLASAATFDGAKGGAEPAEAWAQTYSLAVGAGL